jgi:hypothetical protein
MIYGPDASKCPIKKQVLHAGKEPLIEFCDEMKVSIKNELNKKKLFSFFSGFLSFLNNNSRWNRNR